MWKFHGNIHFIVNSYKNEACGMNNGAIQGI
jgi:hypothetical protein